MAPKSSDAVVIAGAGIAGLTAALAFAQSGFPIEIFERSTELREIGAGLQLSPNATRLLDRLGVLDALRSVAGRPDAVVLRSASSLRELARVPLGDFAEQRWGAPYLVVHRADLQRTLLGAVARYRSIALTKGATVVRDAGNTPQAGLSVHTAAGRREISPRLIVAADGVWSKLRTGNSAAPFSGSIAWRKTFPAQDPLVQFVRRNAVNAFLHPGSHVITYPIRGGSEINVVAFAPGDAIGSSWDTSADFSTLRRVLVGMAGELKALATDEALWTAWPTHTAPPMRSWVQNDKVVAVGDAAHAMTPFAAQGAAMAIEDAYTLALAASDKSSSLGETLSRWETARRPRVERVARRGAFNRFVWHVSGPAAWARNIALKLRTPEQLAADLDWLCAWRPDTFGESASRKGQEKGPGATTGP
jgi:salicylate hydroxylase